MNRILTLIFICLLMLLPACSLPTAPPQPTPFDLDTVQTAVAATLAAQPSQTPAPSATVPAPTAPPPPTAKITYDDALGAARVQFAPMTAWADIKGAAAAQQSATYVLAAAQGQIMSVSVLQGWGYTVTVTGRDGAVLTPIGNGYSFWRGALPATQDYFVRVNAQVDGDFMLRVAINPPGMEEQVFQYVDPKIGLSLAYTDRFAPVVFPYREQLRGAPALALNFIDWSFYDKTNLSEAYFVLNIFDDLNIVTNCNQPSFPQEEARGQEAFGFDGLTFEKSFGSGVGLGSIYTQTIYRTSQKNACIEVVLFVHSTNVDNYAAGTITEYDDAALTQNFIDVLKTISIK